MHTPILKPRYLFELSRKAVSAWVDDFAPSMGAAISYYTVFSLAPLLVIVIAVAGALFGREAVRGEIVGQLQGLIGVEGAIAIQGMVRSASEPSKGLLAGTISIALLIVGATTVFGELQSALDRIWHVPEKDKPKGLRSLVRARMMSFGLILGLAFLLMVSLMVSTAVAAVGSWAGGLLPGWEILLQGINVAVSIVISTLLFAMIFKFMPTVKIEWRDVWMGGFVTALLFEVGKNAIGLYLGKSGVSDSFAAAGSLVVLLAWVYYAAQIFLLGAEFTKVYANEHGSVAGAKAVVMTQTMKKAAEVGSDAVHTDASGVARVVDLPHPEPAEGTLEARPRVVVHIQQPEVAAGTLSDRAQRAVDRRVEAAVSSLTQQLFVLAALSIAGTLLARWQRRLSRDKVR